MKKPLSKQSLLKEASFWDGLKTAIRNNPAKSCHK
jgi:hypothetical protein